MNTRIVKNIIVWTLLGSVPFVAAALFPTGEMAAGVAVLAALTGLGLMELRHGAYPHLPARPSKDAIELYRSINSEL